MVKAQSLQLSSIAKEQSNRFDVDFLMFQALSEKRGYLGFSTLFDVVEKEKVEVPEEFKYCEIGHVEKTGDIDPVSLNENQRDELNENFFKKIEKGDIINPNIGDILLSSVRPNLKKFVYIDEEKKDIFFTKAFIHLRPKKNGLLLYYMLRSVFFNNIIFVSRQGKGYPTLKNTDLLCLNFDRLTVEKVFQNEDKLLPAIQEIEKEIKQLKLKFRKPQEIIDETLADEFGFKMDEFKMSKKQRNLSVNFKDFGNNDDLRASFNFHHPAHLKVKEILSRIPLVKIKNVVSLPVRLGATISPTDYSENSDYYFISPAGMAKGYIELENSQEVSREYFENNKDKSACLVDDVLLRRSGASIGKVAICDMQENLIVSDYMMRIRVDKKKYSPTLIFYLFSSSIYQALIFSNKKGLQLANIFPSQVRDFPLPDISLARQEKIVSKIRTKLEAQEAKRAGIVQKRQEIEKIIENVLQK